MALLATVAFLCRGTIAMGIGYADADGLTAGARFFRDFMIGFAAIIGMALAAWRNYALDSQAKTAANQYKLAEDRMLSERFALAAELMAKSIADVPVIAMRINGIHIMEGLALKNPEDFAEQVVKSLIAYIGDNAQLTAMPPKKDGIIAAKPRILGADVKAAFVVLNTILDNTDIKELIPKRALSFSYQNFSGLNLNLEHVSLQHYQYWIRTDFRGADLRGAHFYGVDSTNQAILRAAKFQGANLRGTNFLNVNLRDARLNADLSGASFDDVDLSGAKLRGARLDETTCLIKTDMSCASVEGAILNAEFEAGTTLEASYGATIMTNAHIKVPLPDNVKQSMNGRIWHNQDYSWAGDIAEYPQNPDLQLEQWDCYALAGVVRNLEQFDHLDGADDILKKARELLREEGKIPGECRGLIARMQSGAAEEDD